jgi:hypothetical protein
MTQPNKLRRLRKIVQREAIILLGAVAITGTLMLGAQMLAEGAVMRKAEAQGALDQDRGQMQLMQTQIAQTGEALAKFAKLSATRTSERFDNDTEILKTTLRQLKDQFRLSDSMQLTISPEAISAQPSLQALNYKVVVREDMEIVIGAMSDMHVYSVLQEFLKVMPGLIRITHLQLDRRAPMSTDSLAQMRAGGVPELTGGRLNFTWITLEDKNAANMPAPSAASATPGGN